MEKSVPERRELNVQLPPSFLESIYRILLVANNRIQFGEIAYSADGSITQLSKCPFVQQTDLPRH